MVYCEAMLSNMFTRLSWDQLYKTINICLQGYIVEQCYNIFNVCHLGYFEVSVINNYDILNRISSKKQYEKLCGATNNCTTISSQEFLVSH